jgi:hypothetical protein
MYDVFNIKKQRRAEKDVIRQMIKIQRHEPLAILDVMIPVANHKHYASTENPKLFKATY